MTKLVCILLWVPLMMLTASAQWSLQNAGVRANLQDVAFYNANTGYAVGDGGVVLKTINGGSRWTAVTPPDKSDVVSVTVTGSNDVIVTTSSLNGNAGIYKTANGGKSWTKVLSDVNSFYAAATPAKTLYSSSSKIYKSDNYGTDWKAQQQLSNTSIYTQLRFPDNKTGIVAGNVSGILTYSAAFWRTVNGQDWYSGDNFSFPNANGFSAFDALGKDSVMMFTNFYNRFMPGDSSQLILLHNFKLRNVFGTTNWYFDNEILIKSFPGSIADCKFFDGGSGYAVSEQGNIYALSKGRNIKKEYSSKTPLHALYMIDKNTGFAVGDNGLILKRGTAGAAMPAVTQLPVLAYPNPAADQVTLRFTVQDATAIRVQVANASGHVILTLPVRVFDKGKQTIAVPIAKLPRGTYYISLINQEGATIGASQVMVAH